MVLQEICESCRETHFIGSPFFTSSSCCYRELLRDFKLLCRNVVLFRPVDILFLAFHCLDHSIVETRRSFQKKFNFTKGQKRDTIQLKMFNWPGTLMMTVLEMSGVRVWQLQRRMLKSFSKWFDSCPGFPLEVLELLLDNNACLRTVSCAPQSPTVTIQYSDPPTF